MDDSVDRIIAQWAVARPGLDVSAMGVLGRLSRLARGYERDLQEVFARHSLQPGEFDILATLVRADPTGAGLTAGELSSSAMVTSGAITNRVDRLVSKGLVTRRTDPNSRRTIRVALTAHGRTVIEAALRDHVENENRLLASLTDAQRADAERTLRALLASREAQR
jgi:DNA-binding MarR family transcriptional regulator